MIIIERHLIGKNIKKIRKRKCLTQEVLADRLYKTQDYISRIEGGKSGAVVNLEVIKELAAVLECNVEDILLFEEDV